MRLYAVILFVAVALAVPAGAQSISGGTIEGVVKDPSGAVVTKAKVEIHNPVTGYSQSATTDDTGAFRLTNIPLNPYHLQVVVAGFQTYGQDVSVRATIPMSVEVKLALAGAKQTVT